MKLAVSIWNDLVAPVFDVSGRIMVVQAASGRIETREHHDLSGLDGLARIRRIAALDIEVLVCGAVSRLCHDLLLAWGIRVIACVSGRVDSILSALLSGQRDIQDFFMPGCPQSYLTHNTKFLAYLANALMRINPPRHV